MKTRPEDAAEQRLEAGLRGRDGNVCEVRLIHLTLHRPIRLPLRRGNGCAYVTSSSTLNKKLHVHCNVRAAGDQINYLTAGSSASA